MICFSVNLKMVLTGFVTLDVTAVCILEAFQNQQSMLLADKVLKQLGKEKAKDKYKVCLNSESCLCDCCQEIRRRNYPKC